MEQKCQNRGVEKRTTEITKMSLDCVGSADIQLVLVDKYAQAYLPRYCHSPSPYDYWIYFLACVEV